MRKKILLLIMLFTLLNAYSQYKETKVFYRNGTVEKGFAKFLFLSSNLKFKKSKTQKAPEILTYKEVDKFIIYNRGEHTEYQHKIVNGKAGSKLLKVKTRGKIDLFYEVRKSGAAPMGGATGGMNFSIGVSSSSEVYYISKKDSPFATKLFHLLDPSKRIFKKIIPEYFGDCPELIEKIKKKEYKKRHIVEIVDFYNNQCK
ncbi:hypothetical protein [Tenacibaculum retecalamus]|uniref:hypothetical protein n=1 Tax=Tenacibaculum retecalamus TaxID=3018315 RepID=UPI0023D96868|nr:hypothetical protein [Tenacibaculum retecalamus]WBX70482.1 hypothetical protein PG912_09395 [Tenacibaculum retecalamus]